MSKITEHTVHMKEVRNCYKIFVGEIVDVSGG
jgi:predicted flavoprotein YhiN